MGRLSVALGIAQDTNVNGATNLRTIDLGDLPFMLSDNARATSGLGAAMLNTFPGSGSSISRCSFMRLPAFSVAPYGSKVKLRARKKRYPCAPQWRAPTGRRE